MIDHLNKLMEYLSLASEDICIINGSFQKIHEIESLKLSEYGKRSIIHVPKHLYKYYADTVTDGVNYTRQNLENNTVFMQNPVKFNDIFYCDIVLEKEEYIYSRLKEFCSRAGIENASKYDKNELILKLIEKLYYAQKETDDIINAFDFNDVIAQNTTNKMFCVDFKNRLFSGIEAPDAIQGALEKEYDFYINNCKTMFAVSSFTVNPDSQLMWAHYANNHKGICLEYEIDNINDIMCHLFPVIYSRAKKDISEKLIQFIDSDIDDETLWKIYFNGPLRKNIEWMYENEWRLIYPKNKDNPDGYSRKFGRISKVYLGYRMEEDARNYYIEECNKRNIPYVEMDKDPIRFAMKEKEKSEN